MGAAPSERSQAGERDNRFSATMYDGSPASGTSAFCTASLALSCVSVLSNRALIELPSKVMASTVIPAALSASCTRTCVALSTLTVDLADDTCTAGASPKKLGRV